MARDRQIVYWKGGNEKIMLDLTFLKMVVSNTVKISSIWRC
jgi:hypothetical protein